MHPLQQADWRVVNLDKLTYAGNLENLRDVEKELRYRFVRGDISDRGLVNEVFQEEQPWVVVNAAAESHVDRSILDATLFVKTNIQGTQVLLDAARDYGVRKFVQISTDEVCGSIATGKFTEESPLRPNSPYAASKAAAELLCRSYYQTYGLPVIVVRSSNNYGPYQFPEKLIPLMILNALQRKPLPIYGQGKNIRDWLYVEDNCRAIVRVIEEGQIGEIYNIGGGAEYHNTDLVRLLCQLLAEPLGRSLEELEELITFVHDRPGHDWRYALDTSKITRTLGWKPVVPLTEGLKRTIEWYLRSQVWLYGVTSGEYQEYVKRVYKRG